MKFYNINEYRTAIWGIRVAHDFIAIDLGYRQIGVEW